MSDQTIRMWRETRARRAAERAEAERQAAADRATLAAHYAAERAAQESQR